jgi:hypothetical protein
MPRRKLQFQSKPSRYMLASRRCRQMVMIMKRAIDHLRRLGCIAILMLTGLLCSVTSAQQTDKSAAPNSRSGDIVRSKWDSSWAGMGISETVFNANHLSRLTTDEVMRSAIAAYVAGYTDGRESISPDCGPQGKDVDRSTVKLYLDIPDDSPTEISSGIRNHLRSMSDVRIVFSVPEADATIAILAIPNESRSSSVVFGYTVSFVATRPCVISTAKNTIPVNFELSHVLETAGTVDDVVRAVSADIDSRVCEKVRNWNEWARKQEKQSTGQK